MCAAIQYFEPNCLVFNLNNSTLYALLLANKVLNSLFNALLKSIIYKSLTVYPLNLVKLFSYASYGTGFNSVIFMIESKIFLISLFSIILFLIFSELTNSVILSEISKTVLN